MARAKAMLNVVDDTKYEPEHRVVGKTVPTRKEPPTFTKPLQNVRVKEGQAIKLVAVCWNRYLLVHLRYIYRVGQIEISHKNCDYIFFIFIVSHGNVVA